MFDRAILHMDLDAFFVSVELLRHPELKGKPLIIGGVGDRGVVSSCSYEARKFGVRSAMPVKSALNLCPEAVVLKTDGAEYSKHSKVVTEIIRAEAPLVEKASIDEFYIDLSGMDQHFGCWKWSKEMRMKIQKKTGLPISMGLSVNKTVSKIATEVAKPNGEIMVEPGTERDFLAPMSVDKMPHIGKETARRLSALGIQTLGQLANTLPALLERSLGKHGLVLREKAMGIDHSTVKPHREAKSISTERTFHEDISDKQELLDRLGALTIKLAYELRQQPKSCSNVAVKVRYSDFTTHTQQRKIAFTTNDTPLLETALQLFDQLYENGRAVRLLGVRFGDLALVHEQTNLFEDAEKESRLMQKLDHIRDKFGVKSIQRGTHIQKKK